MRLVLCGPLPYWLQARLKELLHIKEDRRGWLRESWAHDSHAEPVSVSTRA